MTPILQALCLSEVDNPVEATCRAVIPVSGKRGREGGRQTPGRGDPRNARAAWMPGAFLTNLFQIEPSPLYNPLLRSHFPDRTFHYLTRCPCHFSFTCPGLFYVPSA